METYITGVRVFTDPRLKTRFIWLRGRISVNFFPFWVNLHITYPDGSKKIAPELTWPNRSWQSHPIYIAEEGTYQITAICNVIPPFFFETALGAPDSIEINTIGREDEHFIPV